MALDPLNYLELALKAALVLFGDAFFVKHKSRVVNDGHTVSQIQMFNSIALAKLNSFRDYIFGYFFKRIDELG